MKISERILDGIKTALVDGEASIKFIESAQEVTEASVITGSGSGVGGRIYFDDAFAAARYANPFRLGSRQTLISGNSDATFVAKTGNAADATNPWGYTVNPNSGSPNIDTSFWQLPVRVISAQMPIRTAALSDINGLGYELVEDLMMEFSQLEAASMAVNDDQTGSTSTSTGATDGLRGLASYNTGSTAAFGTSGTSITSGIHTIKTVNQAASAIAYDDIVNAANALPAQYWAMEGTAWHIHPTLIQSLRKLKSTGGGVPMFAETGDDEGGAVAYMMGFPVIPNPYLPAPAAGATSLYLANWPRFLQIVDDNEMVIKMFEETQAGFVTIYAEKRIVSTVRDVFAGIGLAGV